MSGAIEIVWAGDKSAVAKTAVKLVADYVEGALDRKVRIAARVEAFDTVLPAGAITVMSMIEHVECHENISSVAEIWRERLGRLREVGPNLCVLLTLFRGNFGQGRSERLNRIRRLNLLAIELSRAYDLEIADIDQTCALIGAEHLGCDYNCGTPAAQRVIRQVVGSAILNLDLSHIVMPELAAIAATRQSSLIQFVAHELKQAR